MKLFSNVHKIQQDAIGKIFFSSMDGKRTMVTFWYSPNRCSHIVTNTYSAGWNTSFELYGLNSPTNNSINLYNYYANYAGLTSRFSLAPIEGKYWKQYQNYTTFVYLPGK